MKTPPYEKEVTADIEGMGRMNIKLICPTCTACRYFEERLKTHMFGDTEEILWCRKHEKETGTWNFCDDFE